ncbi:MAG: SusC/RagA family TonB-linked outer membrane protein [Bacteroidota bacterium]|nr:SusC/RagA family TonB-linked outer membrane protein [Bacteroidota bacterium]
MKKMSNSGGLRRSLWKFICVMKITILLITFSSLMAVGANSYSQSKKFSFDMRSATVREVINAIEKNSEFIFFYQDQNLDLNRKVNLRGRSLTVNEILDKIFEGSNNVYRINNRQIIVGKKEHNISTNSATKVTKIVPSFPEMKPAEQKKVLTGKVTSSTSGEPIIGASVLVKGTSIGAVTDMDGKYSLSNIPPDATLVFSYVGTKKKEVKVAGHSNIDVALLEETKELEGVVVLAYGTQKKVALTAAVSSVSSKELMQSSAADLGSALAGKLAGLSALQNGGGQPGQDDASIYLRGIGTLNGTRPLIMIDGVPRDNIRTLDVNEVESVSVLKDASATAVFGVRGANGVILITTKRGQEGKAQMSVNLEQSFSTFTREPSRIHSVEYMQLRNLALTNDGYPAKYSDAMIAKYQNPLAGLDPTSPDYAEQVKLRNYIYPDHYYWREFVKKYTPQTRISVDVTGGAQKLSYYMNAGYLHQGGNLNTLPESVLGYDPSAYMDRFTFRSNLDYKVTKSLSAFLNLGTYIEKVNAPNTWMDGFLYLTAALPPITVGSTALGGYGVPAGCRENHIDAAE